MHLTRSINNINGAYKLSIKDVFNKKVPNAKALIMDGYDNLSSFVVNNKSKSDPSQLKNVFEASLDKFEFVKVIDDNIIFSIPDMDTFDFSNLALIEQILNGVIGEFVEVPHKILSILGLVSNLTPINSMVPTQDRVYIMEATDYLINNAKIILGYPLITFPFSNIPAQYKLVFGTADRYVNDNIETWIDIALTDVTHLVNQQYKRI